MHFRGLFTIVYYIMKIFSIFLITLFGNFVFCNENPLIGILTKPMAEEYPNIKTDYTEVVEAKYVHFIEGGGGRAVPISYKWDHDKMYSLMKKLNGVLFVGGMINLVNEDCTELNEYSKAAQRVLSIAYEFNKNEDYFPVWGTCLGFELIMILESGNTNLLKPCPDCDNYNIYITLDQPKADESRLFKEGFTKYQLNAMETQNITFENHQWMIDDATYRANKPLVEKYNVLAHSPSKSGNINYIAAMEHKSYPIYAIQFHPEKYNYEVNPEQPVKRSFIAVTVSHEFANFFVEEARKSKHKFKNREEETENIVQHSHSCYDSQYGQLYLSAKKRSHRG